MTEVPGATGAGAAAPGPVPVAAQQQQQQGGFRPVTYIGCHITLISKSQIRYEGILYTIDTNESTVALRNVRSFGTEGRHRPEGAVPPRAEVFEFVIFRGADILTLDVTPPPQQPQQQVYHDPAIVARSFPPQPQQQVQQQRPIPQNINNSSNNNIQKQHPAQMVGPPMPQVPMPPTATPNIAAPGAPQQPQATNIVRPPQPAQNNVFATAGNRSSVAAPGSATTRTAPQNVVSTPQTAPPSRPQQQPSGDQQTRSTGAPQPGGLRPQPQAANGAVQPGGLGPMPQGYTTGSQRQPAGRPANGVQPGGLRPLPQSHTAANSNNINNRNNNINHSSAGRVQPGGLRPLPPGVQAGPKWGPPVHARNWGPPQGSQGGNHSHNMRAPAPGATVRRANGGNYAGRGRGGSRRQRRRGPGITVPSEDFDFESMHTKFDKVTIDDQQDNIPAIPAGMPAVAQPYDPSKGFFDCLVPEKQIPRERINAAQRRATDLETFGEVGNIHRHNRFRHHNGNSYRGGHNSRRGGRGRRHYNNNMGQLHNNNNNNPENNRNNNGNINQHAQHNTQQQQHN